MANFVFPVALGKVAYYGSLPAANDGLVAVLLEEAGLEVDASLKGYEDLAALLAAANNEQTTMGRQALSSVSVTVGDPLRVDADDVAWTAASGNAIAAIIICYDPDTTTGGDGDRIPLLKFDLAVTPSGADISYVFDAAGIYTAANS